MSFRVFMMGVLIAQANLANPDFYRAIEKGDLPSVAASNSTMTPMVPNPLIFALSHGQYQIAMLLLDKGARTDVEGEDGDTPLIVAMKNYLLTKRMLEKILANGAGLEHQHTKTGMTAIMYGVRVGFVKGVRLLTDFGASLDRINPRDKKGVFDYANDPAMFEFLTKSHRYIAKSLKRFGFELSYDEFGFPVRLAMGADGVLFWVTRGEEKRIAKFCYVQALFYPDGVLEYRKCNEREDDMARSWSTWFDNKLNVEAYDLFFVKDHIRGKTLAQWMVGHDKERDFGSDALIAQEAREKLRALIIRILKKEQGFIGDFNPSNLIFSEDLRDWVVIDGRKAIACYSPPDHEWIWVEYCRAAMNASKDNLLKAFQSYALGPSPTNNVADSESFGVWLMPRFRNGQMEGPTPMAKEKMINLIHSIQLSDLD